MIHRIFILLICFGFLSVANGQSESTIVVDGNKIHYKTFGSGTPILIINGGPGMNSEGFASLAKVLAENNRAIIYDQRGTGKSTLTKADANTLTLDLMIEDIEQLRKHLEIDQWVILGHSFGGLLGAYYSSKFPERVNGLILSSSGGLDLSFLNGLNIRSRLTEAQQDSLSYWTSRIADGDTSYHARLQRGIHLAPAYLYDKTHVPVIAHRLTQGNMTINGLVWQNLRQMDFDCKAPLRSFNAPVLIIQGADDVISLATAKQSDEVFPHSKLVVLPQCSHYGWLEQPTMYFAELERFLEKVNSSDH